VLRAIKGDSGAETTFAPAVAFLPHGRGAKEDARGSLFERRISPFLGRHSLKRFRPVYLAPRITLQLEAHEDTKWLFK
jgi:hypothetical protein